MTDDDLDELRACFDLGFSFDSPDLDPKLLSTFPGLDFYCAVNRQYSSTLSRSSSASFSDCDSASSSVESPRSIIDPGKSSTHVFLGNWLNLTEKILIIFFFNFSDVEFKSLIRNFFPNFIEFYCIGEEPEMVKSKLKKWAQVVACSVRQVSTNL